MESSVFGARTVPGFPTTYGRVFEDRIHSAVQQNDIPKLQKSLQIDYFFHPEDMPYKISPRLFRTAVKNEEWDGTGELGMSVLSVLFDLDPHSLPCNSSTMKKWAQDAIERICDDRGDRLELYSYFERRQAGETRSLKKLPEHLSDNSAPKPIYTRQSETSSAI